MIMDKIKEDKITFSSDGGSVNDKDLAESGRISEEYFKTHSDSNQLQVGEETHKWILNNKEYLNLIKYDGKVIGYSFAFPSNKKEMGEFISGKINEATLFERIRELRFKGCPEAIYLCASVVKKEFRRKGLASMASIKIINKIIGKSKSRPIIFYWGYSKEGDKLAHNISRITELELRKSQ